MIKLVKKVLPLTIINKLKLLNSKIEYKTLDLASKTKLFSDTYYLVTRDFSEEHQAVLKGRKAYYDSISNIGESCALLRRNTHRIEKGLIMRPRRSVFAERFIRETVDCYKEAIQSKELNKAEKKWATDVLDEYFRVIGSNSITDAAKEKYNSVCEKTLDIDPLIPFFPIDSQHFKPYRHNELPYSEIKYTQLKQLFIRRRSVRWYEKKPVKLDMIQKASNIASLAPSACNRQPYRFLFCNDEVKTVSIANCAMGTAGFADNIPAIIVIVGNLSAYPAERDRHVIYIDGSLAAMQLMLALETLGLSTCPINWPEISEREERLRDIIQLKDYERVVMLMAVGYADTTGGIPYSQKKENNLILEDISI